MSQAATLPDHDIPVAEFAKNSRERVIASLGAFKGARVLNIRSFTVGADGALYAGRGLTLRLEQLPQLEEAVAALRAAADALTSSTTEHACATGH